MLKIRTTAIIAVMGVMAWGFGASARAALLLPGGTEPTTGIAVFGGASNSLGPLPFTGTDFFHNVRFTGDLVSSVYSDPANPFAPGDLDFVYQFSNTGGGTGDTIELLSATSFSGYLTIADYTAGTGSGVPTEVTRDSNNAGDTVTWSMPTVGVAPGQTSVDLVVYTNATNYTVGSVSLQDGGDATVAALAPVAIPEPASFALAAFAAAGLAMRRRNSAGK